MATPRKKRKIKPRLERLPDNLPIEEVVTEPKEVLANPEAFKRIGEEVVEELDGVPLKFLKGRIIRPKYVRIDDNRELPPVTAPALKRIIDNSYASAGRLVSIVLAKYGEHLPLYRQSTNLQKPGSESRSADKRWATGCTGSPKCSR